MNFYCGEEKNGMGYCLGQFVGRRRRFINERTVRCWNKAWGRFKSKVSDSLQMLGYSFLQAGGWVGPTSCSLLSSVTPARCRRSLVAFKSILSGSHSSKPFSLHAESWRTVHQLKRGDRAHRGTCPCIKTQELRKLFLVHLPEEKGKGRSCFCMWVCSRR